MVQPEFMGGLLTVTGPFPHVTRPTPVVSISKDPCFFQCGLWFGPCPAPSLSVSVSVSVCVCGHAREALRDVSVTMEHAVRLAVSPPNLWHSEDKLQSCQAFEKVAVISTVPIS